MTRPPARSVILLSAIALAVTATRGEAAQGVDRMNGDALTVRDLVGMCAVTLTGACQAYVAGIADGVRMAGSIGSQAALFCLPERMPGQRLTAEVDASVRFDLSRHPTDDGLLAASFVLATLVSAFPCAK